MCDQRQWYYCDECNELITSGESDVLKHADKNGHQNFSDINGKYYNPYKDIELN